MNIFQHVQCRRNNFNIISDMESAPRLLHDYISVVIISCLIRATKHRT